MQISILGGGSWGTAMAHNISANHDVIMYIRGEENCRDINEFHENKLYLAGNKLRPNIVATTNIEDVVNNEIILNAIPTQNIRDMLMANAHKFNPNSIIVNLSKGIEKTTSKRISEIYEEFLPNNPFAAFSGPSHAEEVIADKFTSVVIASKEIGRAHV